MYSNNLPTGDADKASDEVKAEAVNAYEVFHKMEKGTATVEAVVASSAGMTGWAGLGVEWSGKDRAITLLDGAIEQLSAFKRRRVSEMGTDFEDELFGRLDAKKSDSEVKEGYSQMKAAQTFGYSVHDSLPNIGPISDFVVGPSIEARSEDKSAFFEDMVTCSGHGKNGAIYVLHRDVRPAVAHSLELAGCRATWTVRHTPSQELWKAEHPELDDNIKDHFSTFLLLSMEETDQTMICQTLDDIKSLDPSFSSGFVFDEETVAAGNVADDRYIVQVCRSKVVLLNESLEANTFQLETGSTDGADNTGGYICSAAIADPFVVLRTSTNRAILLKANVETATLERLPVDFGGADLMSVGLFMDLHSSWLQTWASKSLLQSGASATEEDALIKEEATGSEVKSEESSGNQEDVKVEQEVKEEALVLQVYNARSYYSVPGR